MGVTNAFALCAMLTFKVVQTADEKIDELWEFDLLNNRGRGNGGLFCLSKKCGMDRLTNEKKRERQQWNGGCSVGM